MSSKNRKNITLLILFACGAIISQKARGMALVDQPPGFGGLGILDGTANAINSAFGGVKDVVGSVFTNCANKSFILLCPNSGGIAIRSMDGPSGHKSSCQPCTIGANSSICKGKTVSNAMKACAFQVSQRGLSLSSLNASGVRRDLEERVGANPEIVKDNSIQVIAGDGVYNGEIPDPSDLQRYSTAQKIEIYRLLRTFYYKRVHVWGLMINEFSNMSSENSIRGIGTSLTPGGYQSEFNDSKKQIIQSMIQIQNSDARLAKLTTSYMNQIEGAPNLIPFRCLVNGVDQGLTVTFVPDNLYASNPGYGKLGPCADGNKMFAPAGIIPSGSGVNNPRIPGMTPFTGGVGGVGGTGAYGALGGNPVSTIPGASYGSCGESGAATAVGICLENIQRTINSQDGNVMLAQIQNALAMIDQNFPMDHPESSFVTDPSRLSEAMGSTLWINYSAQRQQMVLTAKTNLQNGVLNAQYVAHQQRLAYLKKHKRKRRRGRKHRRKKAVY